MRKVVMLNWVSLDGYFAGPAGEIDWVIGDPDTDKAAHGIGQVDTALFGRVTYQLFESHWPRVAENPDASDEERATANELAELNKVVFSNTLDEVTWENTTLAKGSPADVVKELKQGDGLGIIIFGSGTIVQQLANEGLIDKYMIILTPVVLGAGKALFAGVTHLALDLVSARAFASGNILLTYRPAGTD